MRRLTRLRKALPCERFGNHADILQLQEVVMSMAMPAGVLSAAVASHDPCRHRKHLHGLFVEDREEWPAQRRVSGGGPPERPPARAISLPAIPQRQAAVLFATRPVPSGDADRRNGQ